MVVGHNEYLWEEARGRVESRKGRREWMNVSLSFAVGFRGLGQRVGRGTVM